MFDISLMCYFDIWVYGTTAVNIILILNSMTEAKTTVLSFTKASVKHHL